MSDITIRLCGSELHVGGLLVSGNIGVSRAHVAIDESWQGYEKYTLSLRRPLCDTLYCELESAGEGMLECTLPVPMLERSGMLEVGVCAEDGSRVRSSALAKVRVCQGAHDGSARRWPRLATLTATLSAHGGTLGFDQAEYDGIGEVILPPIENLSPENIRAGVQVLDVLGDFVGEKYATEGIYIEDLQPNGKIKTLWYGYDTLSGGVLGGEAGQSVCSYFAGVEYLTACLTSLEYGVLSQNANLKSINLPCLTSLGNSAFSGDLTLKSVTLGSPEHPVSSISQYAFSNASALTEITIYTEGGVPIDDESWRVEGVTVRYIGA